MITKQRKTGHVAYKRTLITFNKNVLIHPARLIDNPDCLVDNLMTSIFSLKFNSLAPFEKTAFFDVMDQGMSRDAWDEFSKTILVRHIISLWNPLFGSFCVVKKIFAFSMGGGGGGGIFSLSTHALTCLR